MRSIKLFAAAAIVALTPALVAPAAAAVSKAVGNALNQTAGAAR